LENWAATNVAEAHDAVHENWATGFDWVKARGVTDQTNNLDGSQIYTFINDHWDWI